MNIIDRFIEFFIITFKNALVYLVAAATIASFFLIKQEFTINAKWVILIGAVVLSSFNSCVLVIRKREKEISELGQLSKDTMKSVVSFDNANGKPIFYIEYSEFLPEDTIVSIYYYKPNAKLICIARVLDVYPNNYSTIEIMESTVKEGRKHLLEEICTTSSDILKNVFIKTIVKRESILSLAKQIAEDKIEKS